MKKLFGILIIIFLILLFANTGWAKTAFVGATNFTGGSTGYADAIECEDIIGDNTDRAIATGDVLMVFKASTKELAFYVYDSTGTDTEGENNTPASGNAVDPIVPDDRAADCSGEGQWNLVKSYNVGASTTPGIVFFDSDAPGTDKEVGKIYWNYVSGGDGSENANFVIAVMSAGSEVTYISSDVANDEIDVAKDINLASGKLVKINNKVVGSETTLLAAFSFPNPTDADFDDIKVKLPRAITITAVYGDGTAGTSTVVNCKEVDPDGDDTDAVTIDGDWTITSGTQMSDTSFTNAALDANDWLQCDVGTVTGTVTNVSLTFWGYEQ